jgi:hypothetical protein
MRLDNLPEFKHNPTDLLGKRNTIRPFLTLLSQTKSGKSAGLGKRRGWRRCSRGDGIIHLGEREIGSKEKRKNVINLL